MASGRETVAGTPQRLADVRLRLVVEIALELVKCDCLGCARPSLTIRLRFGKVGTTRKPGR